ncbi:MAG: response regulator transcription factor [Bacteroidota bacterium]|nr:response regulator transcription factor [Bacteroidota bacterium]
MSPNHILKVALYDDNAELRISLSKLFAVFPEFELIGAFAHANQLLENCHYRKPDVILMDIDMPGISGIEAVALIKTHFPDIKVLMLTVFDDNQKVFNSICNGAVGYILKKEDPTSILEAVKDAYAGGAPMTNVIATKVLGMFREQSPPTDANLDLTEREKEILTLLTRGMSYKMIASECQLSIDTVRFHIKKIYEKLHVHSMTEAVSKALKNKWV